MCSPGDNRMRTVDCVFHITPFAGWKSAEAKGEYRAASLESEGFIHASTLAQIIGTANRFYAGQRGLVLLMVAANHESSIAPLLRFEEADGQLFPHIYGAIPMDAIVRVLPFEPDANGSFTLPSELQSGLESAHAA